MTDRESRYRTFFENSLDAMFITTPDGRVLEANAAACELFGYTEEELIRIGRKAVIDPQDPRLLPALKERKEKGRFAGELNFRRKDGTIVPVEITSVVSRMANGEERASIIVRDVTGRKRAEEALRRNEAFTRAVMDHLPVGLAVNSVDPAVDFVYMNDNFPKFYRTTREALADPGAFWDAVYEDPDFRERIRKRVLDDCAGHDPERMHWEDVPIARKGEETRYVNARNTPVPGASLMISTVWDVTDRKRAEEEREKLGRKLLQAQRMEAVGTLAGGIAHDFNNALTGIFGFGNLLREQISGNAQAERDLGDILRCAERAATLTRQLLTFARRQAIEAVDLDLNALVAGLEKLIGKAAGERIEVRTRLADGLPAIRGDRGQIEQALMNLCLNARDAMPEGGKLFIGTGIAVLGEEDVARHPYMRAGRHAVLEVTDTGVGMDEGTRERVFDPFFTTKEPDRGTGLGLAVVYGIVKQHNGFIHLYSEPGKGTTLKAYFPAAEPAPDAVSQDLAEEPVRGGTETVLLADDEESVLAVAHRTLKELGYDVLIARDGEEAVGLFRRSRKVDLVVLDVVMPGKGGPEAYREMQRDKPGLKAIFMSGYSIDAVLDRLAPDGGHPFLQKPFAPTMLARKIREVLDAGI
ncbi:MAG: PAS domain S-box protein [Thermodesulfobacteriota bacterium]